MRHGISFVNDNKENPKPGFANLHTIVQKDDSEAVIPLEYKL